MKSLTTCLLLLAFAPFLRADPLPSWKPSPRKAAILSFVDRVTDPTSTDFVAPVARIAVFDNDGTLWAEKPVYFQMSFVADKLREMAPHHPEWKETEPFQSFLAGDLEAVAAQGEEALMTLLMATHANMSTEEFQASVANWIRDARHSVTGMRYTEMVYQPMLELLNYLRANDFKTYIVSGGGRDFMRIWAEDVYGIPPEQVVGSTIAMEWREVDGKPVLMRLPEIGFINDKGGKPIGIHNHIGRRPILAFGNSDGDLEMLQWTTAGKGPRMGVIIHHTDGVREFAYDRDSKVGRLDKALSLSGRNGWQVVDMKSDWSRMYPQRAE